MRLRFNGGGDNKPGFQAWFQLLPFVSDVDVIASGIKSKFPEESGPRIYMSSTITMSEKLLSSGFVQFALDTFIDLMAKDFDEEDEEAPFVLCHSTNGNKITIHVSLRSNHFIPPPV